MIFIIHYVSLCFVYIMIIDFRNNVLCIIIKIKCTCNLRTAVLTNRRRLVFPDIFDLSKWSGHITEFLAGL